MGYTHSTASLTPRDMFVYLLYSVLVKTLHATSEAREVLEVDGILTVSEPVNIARMTTHFQIWASDLRGADKLDSLMAAAHIREITLLTDTLATLTGIPFYKAMPEQTDQRQHLTSPWPRTTTNIDVSAAISLETSSKL